VLHRTREQGAKCGVAALTGLVLAAALLVSPAARADAVPAGDAAAAARLADELEAAGKGQPLAQALAEALAASRKALERARGARAAGDEPHAKLLDALALEWAQAAAAQRRAFAAEQAAARAAKEAREVSVQLGRARALLAETQAQRGLAEAELARVEAEAREARDAAAAAEAKRTARGAGARKAATPKQAKP
jgi:hypothetical protein